MSAGEPNGDLTMAAQRAFKVASKVTGEECVARLGKLALPGRRTIDTPNFTAVSSRGVIPHLTPEVVAAHTSVGSAYMALEDFIEKKDPPILKIPLRDENARRLQTFTAFPKDITTVMAARRYPGVAPPEGNNARGIKIFTSTGFDTITIPTYASHVKNLRPDIVLGPADLPIKGSIPVPKRQLRMIERTEDWMDKFMQEIREESDAETPEISIFAPIMPLEHRVQWGYLNHLSENYAQDLAGLAIYDVDILPELTKYQNLSALPKLSMDLPKSPQDILRQVLLGIDIIMVPFINTISDAGIALTFTLTPPQSSEILPLGINLWSTEHKISLEPLVDGCPCYACQSHHRAFITHLLNAKEMLGWNLLQIHNHHVVSSFLAAIRQALEVSQGSAAKLEELTQAFSAAYEPELPLGTGERPRARGYHFKSEAAQEKYNKPGWKDLNSGTPPVKPEVDGAELEEKGFAEKQGQ